MARQRMIRPDFFTSESLSECSYAARLAFIGIWVMSDDCGNMKLSKRKLRVQLFPFDDITDEEFTGILSELESVGCIKWYENDGEEYVTTPNFGIYQKINRPSKTSIPEPSERVKKAKRTSHFRDIHSPITDDSVSNQGDITLKKERKKEVDIFPKEKISTSVSVGADADRSAPPSTQFIGQTYLGCPHCGSAVTRGPNGFVCKDALCFEAHGYVEPVPIEAKERGADDRR